MLTVRPLSRPRYVEMGVAYSKIQIVVCETQRIMKNDWTNYTSDFLTPVKV